MMHRTPNQLHASMYMEEPQTTGSKKMSVSDLITRKILISELRGISSKLDRLISNVDLHGAPEQPQLTTPDGIEFVNIQGNKGIVFPSGKKALIYYNQDSDWLVWSEMLPFAFPKLTNLPLVKVSLDKLEVGKVYYTTDCKGPEYSLDDLERYVVRLGENKHVCIVERVSATERNEKWKNWYEVVFDAGE